MSDSRGKADRRLLAGVVGWPVAHSKSPLIFAHWFAEAGIAGSYQRLAVRPEEFGPALRALPKAGFRGVNVTIPHKEAALAALNHGDNHVDDLARRIGAVNTVTVGSGVLDLSGNPLEPTFTSTFVTSSTSP